MYLFIVQEGLNIFVTLHFVYHTWDKYNWSIIERKTKFIASDLKDFIKKSCKKYNSIQ